MTESAKWVVACAEEDLAAGALKTCKREGKQLVLGRTAEGRVFALDNRCPHEGYPLAQGNLKGESLTCAWHNWKFDVGSGTCLLGGEGVRAYPVRICGESVEVDIAEPPAEQSFARWLDSLDESVLDHDLGRGLRDAARLLHGGYDARALLVRLAALDARHAEYGSSHVLPLAADAGAWLSRRSGTAALNVIAPAIDLCGEVVYRRPARLPADGIPGATEQELRRAVEAEELERARSLLTGAFDRGVAVSSIEEWLLAVVADHFLDFGHPLIYLVKSRELLAGATREEAALIYDGLLVNIVYGTREDTLPYMATYAKRLREVEAQLPELHARAKQSGPGASYPAELRDAVLDGSAALACDALWQALTAGVAAPAIARALVAAGAHRLLRFDTAHDENPEVAENWLWVTHRFTFASAVREAVERFDHPATLRLLFHAVMFVHSGRPLDLPAQSRRAVPPGSATGPADPARTLSALARRDPEVATSEAELFLAADGSVDALEVAVLDQVLANPRTLPIYEVHDLKTWVAACKEHRALAGTPDRNTPILAAIRYLATRTRERRVQAAAGRALDWVVEGKVPRKLTQ